MRYWHQAAAVICRPSLRLLRAGQIKAHLKVVISDKKDAYALERARQAKIPAVYINPKDFQ